MRGVLVVVGVVAVAAAATYYVMQNVDDNLLDDEISYAADIAALKAVSSIAPTAPRSTPDVFELMRDADWPVAIAYDSLIDADGGVYAQNVTLTVDALPDVGVNIDELHLWDVTVDEIMEFVGGDDPSALLTIGRVEAVGMAPFGITELMNGAMNEMIMEALPANLLSEDEMAAMAPAAANALDLNIGRILIDGLSIGLPDTEQSEPLLAYMSLFKNVSYDAVIVEDYVYDMDMVDDGLIMDMSMRMDFAGYKDVSGWNYGFGFADGTSFTMDMKADPEGPMAEAMADFAMSIDYSLNRLTLADLRLNAIFDMLADGVPEMTQTDVLSLGRWTVSGLSYDLNGKPFVSQDLMVLDARDFHWLLPTHIELRTENTVYHVTSMIDMVDEQMKAMSGPAIDVLSDMDEDMEADMAAADPSASDMAQLQQVKAMLEANDLDVVAFDSLFTFDWSPQDGATGLNYLLSLRDNGSMALSVDGQMPDYAALSALDLNEAESWSSPALAGTFAQQAAIIRGQLDLTDKGGLDRAFSTMIAFLDMMPEDQMAPQLAAFKGADPTQMRNGVAGMLSLASGSVTQVYPSAAGYIRAFSSFLTSGGTLTAVVAPEEPLTAASFAQMQQGEEPLTPEMVDAMLGLDVTWSEAAAD
ncbi:hypothetical protein [Parvularcula sp. LCG005]|uniref:hypothetical protein n=1 Tax=Parvularcula sp. LCG005 TaxID=3078805 RepID=UPI002941BC89|nr:hypothetical protein [Parvularcula sp. LCG005]WOI51957.1 hypothetical protein RUI03_07285 [Parvularcula sp. LCG005]